MDAADGDDEGAPSGDTADGELDVHDTDIVSNDGADSGQPDDVQDGSASEVVTDAPEVEADSGGPEGPCDDGLACTSDDVWVDGECVGMPNCDDGNLCTSDSCTGTGCAYEGFSLASCEDGSPCTVEDACDAGLCVGVVACDDFDPCTVDQCDPDTGDCSFEAISGCAGEACGALGHGCPEDLGFECVTNDPDDGVDPPQWWCENEETSEVFVPGSVFWMGCNEDLVAEVGLLDKCDPDERPQHLVQLGSFAIDRTEVTITEFAEFLSALAPDNVCTTAEGSAQCQANTMLVKAGGTWIPDPEVSVSPFSYDALPVLASWFGASAYCAWADKPAGVQRLCTEAEWAMAARGSCSANGAPDGGQVCRDQMRLFPWGNEVPSLGKPSQSKYCCWKHFLGGQNYKFDEWDQFSNTYAGDVTGFKRGASPYGALRMGDNFREWVQDWFAPGFFFAGSEATCGDDWSAQCADSTCVGVASKESFWVQPANTAADACGMRVARGHDCAASQLRIAFRAHYKPTRADRVGLRCCRDLESI